VWGQSFEYASPVAPPSAATIEPGFPESARTRSVWTALGIQRATRPSAANTRIEHVSPRRRASPSPTPTDRIQRPDPVYSLPARPLSDDLFRVRPIQRSRRRPESIWRMPRRGSCAAPRWPQREHRAQLSVRGRIAIRISQLFSAPMLFLLLSPVHGAETHRSGLESLCCRSGRLVARWAEAKRKTRSAVTRMERRLSGGQAPRPRIPPESRHFWPV